MDQRWPITLQWRHNGRDRVSNHQPHDCLLNRLFRRRSKKTSKLRVTGPLCGEFTGDRWIPRTKGQQCGKCFHLMTSSWTNDPIRRNSDATRSLMYFDSRNCFENLVCKVYSIRLQCVRQMPRFLQYSDVIMGTMAYKITSLKIAYSIIHSGADQRKHQSSALLALCAGNSPHKVPMTRKMFPFETSSCCLSLTASALAGCSWVLTFITCMTCLI